MTHAELRQLAIDLRAAINSEMSMPAFAAVQAKIAMINNTVAALDRAEDARVAAERLRQECVKWV